MYPILCIWWLSSIDLSISSCDSSTIYLSRSATIYLQQYIQATAAEIEGIEYNIEAIILGGGEIDICVL
jgi:hypothetical protein